MPPLPLMVIDQSIILTLFQPSLVMYGGEQRLGKHLEKYKGPEWWDLAVQGHTWTKRM